MAQQIVFQKLKNITLIGIDDVYDFEVEEKHRIIAKHADSKDAFYTSNCWHPGVIEFITAKQQPGRLTKFNMSVNCSDAFMDKIIRIENLKKNKASKEEIEKEDTWDLIFPDTTFHAYNKKWDGVIENWNDKGYPTIVYETIKATYLWELIMKSTYNRAEPGVLFLDKANKTYLANYVPNSLINKTNPCSEQTLPESGSCNLSSINLTQFYDKNSNSFNFEKFKKITSYTVRFLDNVNDLANMPLEQYTKFIENFRRIGVGVLGWGSLLYMMKIPFGSSEAGILRDKIMKILCYGGVEASISLAKEKGMYPKCEPEKQANVYFWDQVELPDNLRNDIRQYGLRNSALFSCQPTGNTSILANIVSGGIEPIFMNEYIRTVIVNDMPPHISEVCPKWYEGEWYETPMFKFKKEGDETILYGKDKNNVVYKIDKNRGLTKEVLCEDYGVRYLKTNNEWDPKADYALTTEDLTTTNHLDDLKGFMKWIDASASKTVNCPNNIKLSEFKDIYLNAYKTGYIKGVTTYRQGTMATVLSAKDEKTSEPSDEEIIREDVKLPNSAPAVMKTLRAEGKKYYLTVVFHEDNMNRPFALFVKTNNHEGNTLTHDAVEHMMKLARKKKIPKRHIDAIQEKITADNNVNKVARVISFLLRHGVLIKNIVAVLDKVENAFVGTFCFQVKKFLSQYIKDGEKVEDEKCMECGSTNIVFNQGCRSCNNCGSSRCG